MKRRTFIKRGTTGAIAAGALSIACKVPESSRTEYNRNNDNWLQAGSGKKLKPNRKEIQKYDVAVIGGGMSGICAAVASARNGAKTILIQDRPVLGGNASSEMRVTVNNGSHEERETGIIEEILIENWVYNKQESYPVWDHVLYNYVVRQDNLTLMLNTQALRPVMEGNTIKSAICWGLTNETEYTIYARQFIDCSGDGLLAAMAGAEYRTGREGKLEFGESHAPDKPDGWTMGDCIMMVTKDMGRPMPFKAPDYAIPFDYELAFKDKHRRIDQVKEGYWWIEVGDDFDIIANRENIRHKLMAYFYGVWDYIKNSGNHPEAESIVLDWVCSIPGRRESRRFMGDYILTQVDIENCCKFNDAVAFGGWSFDEHNPGGIEDLSQPASYFHVGVKDLYQIPYRSLYSKNIRNLSLAGRNISVTHMALSSTRIMGTCSTMGQAVGTAAAMCVRKDVNPREIGKTHIKQLQEQLLRDDAFIPYRPAADDTDLARKADVIFGSSTVSGNARLLIDGIARDRKDEVHHWEADGKHATLQLEWKKPVNISKVELKGDTAINRKLMMHKNPEKNVKNGQILDVPPELVKALDVEVRISGIWKKMASVNNNITRLIKINFESIKTNALRITFTDTWGKDGVRLYEVRCYNE